jgi:hypothetical protein
MLQIMPIKIFVSLLTFRSDVQFLLNNYILFFGTREGRCALVQGDGSSSLLFNFASEYDVGCSGKPAGLKNRCYTPDFL